MQSKLVQLFVSVSENNDNSMADQARAAKGTKLGTQVDLGPKAPVFWGQKVKDQGHGVVQR